MVKDKITFLTKKDFDINLLIENLKKNFGSIKKIEDQKILNEIIILLKKKRLHIFITTGNIFFKFK